MIASPAIYAALKKRYAQPEWALMLNVANGTGARNYRYADALAMNLFPSRGLELHGFEVKVSKSDWKRELAQPHKAEEICQYCNRWWIVAPKEIVDKSDLPPTWGLIEFDGKERGGLRQIVDAPKLEPKPWPRSFMAAMLRRSSEIDTALIDSVVAQRVADARERMTEDFDRRVRERTIILQEKVDKIAAIEQASGISLTDWRASKAYGRAIKLIETIGLDEVYGSLGSHIQTLEKHLQRVRAAFDEMAKDVSIKESADA
ncbi:hypothetical protein [Terrarubrum flagellatum]|uniref:hypothetical protein n=1 Tax=Terrirubrum flagellatum TaxID=2895980 RepID=UPI0031454280